MKKVYQSRLNGPGPPGVGGNCFAACMATIFEVPISQVPDPNELEPLECSREWNEWLAQFGLYHSQITVTDFGQECGVPMGYSIGVIEIDEEQGWYHAVVCYDGEIVWNPTPGMNLPPDTPIDEHVIFISKEPWTRGLT